MYRRSRLTRVSLTLAAAVGLALTQATARVAAGQARAGQRGGTADWSAVEQALGRRGAKLPGDVIRFGFPRGDLRVTVAGVQIRPALALGSWIAFKRVGGGHAMMMGDLVLTDGEVNPVVTRLQEGGVEQTALHNHLLGESPRTMYLHVAAHADPVEAARAVRAALELTGTPLDTGDAAGAPAAPAEPFDLDTAQIARALGHAGRVNGGAYQVSVPRAETIREGGRVVPPSMGVATAINFQPTGRGRAAIAGDFVMTAREVNPVIRVLREHGIAVTALHSHMTAEAPRLFFMHFWANDDAVGLARALGAALQQTGPRGRASP